MTTTCPICGDELTTDEELRAHDHAMPTPWEHAGAGFECPECGAAFDEQEELVAHQGTAHAGGAAAPGDAGRVEPR